MSERPAVHRTTHRIRFSDLDPYGHMRTAAYGAYFIDHRMDAIRELAGWDIRRLAELPFLVFTKRMEVDFVRPVSGDQVVTITSVAQGFEGADALIECVMEDERAATMARCRFVFTYIDRATGRPADWPPEAVEPFVVRSEG